MRACINLADVPVVDASEFHIVMEMLIENGQGLALLRGLKEEEIRVLENRLWIEFEGSDTARLAIALRFRALLDVFASRRLKALFLDRGFRLLRSAVREAAQRPLNIRFGFNAQQLLLALDAATNTTAREVREDLTLQIAA
ncbi:hypothetical protein [Hyphomicrobium sp. 99]|uniref:hypothetical protein n=1 Tax=Hyphomicrobium sp. 99 TaxID=1163419 RepID=UPI0005F7ECF2|nr:hypothetical protein [Hyphomicrobium sp. 99]